MVAAAPQPIVSREATPMPTPPGQPRRLSEILPEVLRRRGLLPDPIRLVRMVNEFGELAGERTKSQTPSGLPDGE